MYTQCPQCDAAFRITVDVLQQARGQVRCGNCDAAFNALDHLTEEAPVATGAEPEGPDDLERSQLLETLDRLAGTEEVRIEDTGVEWLVVEDGEESADEPAADDAEEASASMRWVIEDETDADDDGDGDPPLASDEDTVTSRVVADADAPEEPRYDDNTELPDDFEEQHQYSAPADPPQRRATDQLEFVVENDDAQADLELSEPDDWSDLLDDIHGDAGTESDGEAGDDASVEAEPANQAGADAVPEPDEPSDVDDAASLAASMGPAPSEEQEIALVASQLDDLLETMGSGQEPALDLTALRSAAEAEHSAAAEDAGEEPEDMAVDDGESDEAPPVEEDADVPPPDEDWIPETADGEALAEEAIDATDDADEATDSQAATKEESFGDAPAAESLEDDVSSAAESVDDEESFGDQAAAESLEDGVFAAAADSLDDEDLAAYAAEATESDASEPDEDEQPDAEPAKGAASDTDADADEDTESTTDERADGAETVAQELAAMTGNMAIDADFVRALQDGDLEATMVDEDGSPLVETIIMEGESVSGALTSTTSGRIRESLKDPGSLLDTYISMRKGDEQPAWPARRLGIAALVLLAITLIGQIVHQSRDSLATNGAFQRLLGPVYELLGSPLVPDWDIRGWQFEATNGGTDQDNSVLTIYSRLSNRAESALPYPLVHVSLTDRYEEIIGSRMLEPSDYLAGNADPERLVAAGADFTAVITIAEPSADATGFKLNVCYPAGGGNVRCAIEDFKTP